MTERTSKRIDMARDGLAIKAEYLQTDQWAIDAILRAEILTPVVVDPCAGDGRMATAALQAGARQVYACDLYDWGFKSSTSKLKTWSGVNALDLADHRTIANATQGATWFMNPPFSIACEFVDQAMTLGARKVVCFQRSVWRESNKRRAWWLQKPPSRVYQCGDRAICWYGTIPMEERQGGAYQPHSFFVWERNQPAGTLMGTLWKADA